MKWLSAIHRTLYLQEEARKVSWEQEVEQSVMPDDQVYINVFHMKCYEPRHEGPYKVARATLTAVYVEGDTRFQNKDKSSADAEEHNE